MAKQIYVNLPVKDLRRSMAFFSSLGHSFNPRFTAAAAACLILGDNLFAMLLVEKFFKTFTAMELCDAKRQTEVLVCLSCDSRAQVDDLVAKALAAGGTAARPPQDHGFMYGHGFEDPDGHIWDLIYMEPGAEGARA